MQEHSEMRVGLIGAGYIAAWHASAIGAIKNVRLTAVCDPNLSAATALAKTAGAEVFSNLDVLISSRVCDAVHILTPPDTHKDIAIKCLAGGLHVFVEKPVALSVDEVRQISEAAEAVGRSFGASHNFLGLGSYEKLKALKHDGKLGLVSSAQINWCFPLPPLRSGPYGVWFMRETRNLLLELGPHPFSFAVDLFGPLDIEHVSLNQWIRMPDGRRRPQSWRILAKAANVDITIALSLVEGYDDRTVTLRGSSALARLDYAADTLVTSYDNARDLIVNPLLKELAKAAGYLSAGLSNALVQTSSLNQRSPYALSFRNSILAFYKGVLERTEDSRFSARSAVQVMQAIEDSLKSLPQDDPVPVPISSPRKPTILVIGGTGFIGRSLTRRLADRGFSVRVLSRGRDTPFSNLAASVEMVGASLNDEDALVTAMDGIEYVFNLAKSMDKSWQAALDNDVATCLRIAYACARAGVKRLIYTGTIASYDMSDPKSEITERTGFGDLRSRNIYARSKAECEQQLTALCREKGLPLVIARPGIVVGNGGPLQHWGIGRWHGPGAVRLWGSGRNVLPFVLCDDVADGLIAMMDSPASVGETFNLTGDIMFSGRDYFAAIHARTGAKVRVVKSSLNALWLFDAGKYWLKRYGLGKRDAIRPSLTDWKSRGHLSPFNNNKAKQVLNWKPEADREAFLRRAIDEAHLFW